MLLAVGGNGKDCPFNPNCSHFPAIVVILGTTVPATSCKPYPSSAAHVYFCKQNVPTFPLSQKVGKWYFLYASV